jgi:tetratricopeptide (TPR) repeat protein
MHKQYKLFPAGPYVKLALFTALFAVILPSFATAGNLADSAAIYYDKKNYEGAIRCYGKILSEGKESWKLHYNLGNAYFKSNAVGKAILHYEIARKLNPLQPDLLNNISIADSRIVDKIEVKDNFLESKIKSGALNLFSVDGWAWASIISLFSGLGLFFLYMISASPALKKLFFWSGFVILLGFIISMLLGFSALREKNAKDSAVITSPSVSFYNEPKSENKKPFQLHEGTRVHILDADDGWMNIQLQNGNEGWVRAETLGVY